MVNNEYVFIVSKSINNKIVNSNVYMSKNKAIAEFNLMLSNYIDNINFELIDYYYKENGHVYFKCNKYINQLNGKIYTIEVKSYKIVNI